MKRDRVLPADAGPHDIMRARRWTICVWLATLVLVICSCVPLYVQAGEIHGKLGDMQVYAADMSAKMGLPRTAIVLEHRFGNRHQRGESRVGLKLGTRKYYVLLADTWLWTGPVDAVKNTIRHEICHLVTFEKLGKPTERGKFHGPSFKRCAQKWGISNNYVAD